MKELFSVIGIVFILSFLPALVKFLMARHRFSGGLVVNCPETGRAATIRLKSAHAAATALTGDPDLRVKSCNRWGGPVGHCHDQCLDEEGPAILDRTGSA